METVKDSQRTVYSLFCFVTVHLVVAWLPLLLVLLLLLLLTLALLVRMLLLLHLLVNRQYGYHH